MIDLLKMEYDTLRAEVVALSSGRLQFMSIPSISVAAAVALVVSQRPTTPGVALIAALLGLVLASALLIYLQIGRSIAALSARIAFLETRLNDIVSSEYGLTLGLDWERQHQTRSGLSRIYNGPGVPQP